MKKNLFKLVLGMAVVITAGVNCFQAQEEEPLSDLTLANIDALANDENNRCDVKDCKSAASGTCCYYVLDSKGTVCETGEKRPYVYDPNGLM